MPRPANPEIPSTLWLKKINNKGQTVVSIDKEIGVQVREKQYKGHLSYEPNLRPKIFPFGPQRISPAPNLITLH